MSSSHPSTKHPNISSLMTASSLHADQLRQTEDCGVVATLPPPLPYTLFCSPTPAQPVFSHLERFPPKSLKTKDTHVLTDGFLLQNSRQEQDALSKGDCSEPSGMEAQVRFMPSCSTHSWGQRQAPPGNSAGTWLHSRTFCARKNFCYSPRGRGRWLCRHRTHYPQNCLQSCFRRSCSRFHFRSHFRRWEERLWARLA